MSSTDSNKKHTMQTKSNDSSITIVNDTHEIIKKPFDSLQHKYQIFLEQSMRDKNFIFDNVFKNALSIQ